MTGGGFGENGSTASYQQVGCTQNHTIRNRDGCCKYEGKVVDVVTDSDITQTVVRHEQFSFMVIGQDEKTFRGGWY